MANATNKDQFVLDYDKQRLSFIEALKRFNLNKGTPIQRIPEIGGQEVDLYHLYQKVTSMGGWHKVNNDQLWERILSDFWLPKACTNAVEVLKHIYFRYLNLYEKVNFLGEDVDTRKNDDEDGPTRKKICLPIESIPLSYNYNQHKLTDAQRQQHNLSTNLKKKNPYEKIELSLQSGLPNDVDHAVNVCVLLSTEGRHTIDLHKTTCLIELLLAHIGIFEEDMFLEELYSSCWRGHTGRDFLRFWYESVKRKDIRALITYKGHVYSQREMAGEQVLNLGRDIGVGDIEGQRVLQMAVFIRNLSFEECNQQFLASSSAVFKFLILCLYNTYGNLRQMALDTLANLAGELSLVSVEDFNTQLMLDFIHESLVSEDRFCLVRGMEFMSKIIQPSVNLSVLSTHVRSEAYGRLVDLLTIQDIQIIVHSLEALYKLSKAGEPFTTKIARVHKAIDILVSLITIEAQSFGPGSLVGIKVVEYVPPVTADDRDLAKRPTTVIQPVNPDCINIYQIPSSQLSQSSAEVKDKPSPVVKPKKPVTDIQATSTSWLKATYELKKKSKVNQVELFSDYLQFCRKFGIPNTLSSAEFLQMVKTLFDQVEVLSINRKNGDRDVFFEGLCKRPTQRPFAVTTIQEDKVDKPICVNVSHQQTPQSTLRQRLMEPLRHSLQHQLTHTGGTNPATPKNAGIPSNVKSSVAQALSNRKPGGRVIAVTPQSKGKRKLEGLPPNHQSMHNGPNTDTTTTDASSVKSLLAKKLCHGNNPELNTSTDSNSSSNNNHHQPFVSNTITSQPFNTSQHSPGTFVVCPAVTSSLTNPSHRPVYQQGRSSAATSDIWCNKSTGVQTSQAAPSLGQAVSTVSSSLSSQSQTANSQPSLSHNSSSSISSSPLSSTAIQSGHKTQNVTVQTTIASSVTDIVKHNNSQHSNPVQIQSNGIHINNNVTVMDSNNTVVNAASTSCLQNGGAVAQQGTNYSVTQPSNTLINTSIAATMAPQTQQISLQTIQQPSHQIVTSSSLPHSGLSVVQQGTNVPVIPQQTHQNVVVSGSSISLQGSNNLITVGHPTAGVIPQPQQQQFVSQSNPSIAMNQLIRAPSNTMQVPAGQQQQQSVLTPNIVSMGTANVTQSITAPAVAAMLTSGTQQIQTPGQQQQMVISTPLQQATMPGAAPNSVLIQTQPGTIVVPPRQVLVQGNVGPIQQNVVGQQQPGTVSFVVPQYRQTPNLIIQQSGAVNVVPSLTLQAQQPNPAPQTLTGHVSTTPLGTRQIIINQSQLPVGMQISSIQGNAGNVCVAPQQQQQQPPQQTANIVIQQPNQILSQPSPSPNNLQLTVNGTQVVMKESLPPRSDVVVNNSLNPNQILTHQQQPLPPPPQQEQVVQISTQRLQQQQQLNQQTNSQLVIQTSQPNLQQDQSLVTSSQCNGVNHEVNGVLGSPDSMSSDLPPSPQSTGLQSDILNGQLSDSDSNKSDLAKLVDKSGRPKLNGIVHNFENGCYNNAQQQQQPPPPAKISPNSIMLSKNTNVHANQQTGQDNKSNPRIRIVNGTGSPINSISQPPVTGSEPSGNAPQKIIVNVVQRQTHGNGVSVNGLSQSQQQQQFNSSIQQQQQQSNNAVRMVVSNNMQQPQQSGKGKIIIQQPQQRPVSTVIPSSSRPQTRISTLPSSSTSSSTSQMLCNVTNTSTKVPQQRSVISQSGSCDSDSVAVGANKTPRPGQQVNQVNMITPGTKRKAAIVAMTDKTPVRLRGKKKGEDAGVGPDGQQGKGQTPVSIVLEYKCEWGTCRRNFSSARRVFLHVFRHHIPKAKESCCQWFTCEKMVRKRWSLVSHIQDYHCTEMAMRSACHRRFTLSQNPSAPLPPPPPQPMLYPPDAAAQAIRRFIIKPPFPEFAEQREGPVSKHIRLTAALILRNVCHHSPLGRKLISRHEQQINYNCMNPMDASTALSSCLWDILHYGEAHYKSTSTASHLP